MVGTISQSQFSVYMTTIRASFAGWKPFVNLDEVVTLILELSQDFRHAGRLYSFTDVLVVSGLHVFNIQLLLLIRCQVRETA